MLAMKLGLKDEYLIFILNKNFSKDYSNLFIWMRKYTQAKENEALWWKEEKKNGDKKRPHNDKCGAPKEGGENHSQK